MNFNTKSVKSRAIHMSMSPDKPSQLLHSVIPEEDEEEEDDDDDDDDDEYDEDYYDEDEDSDYTEDSDFGLDLYRSDGGSEDGHAARKRRISSSRRQSRGSSNKHPRQMTVVQMQQWGLLKEQIVAGEIEIKRLRAQLAAAPTKAKEASAAQACVQQQEKEITELRAASQVQEAALDRMAQECRRLQQALKSSVQARKAMESHLAEVKRIAHGYPTRLFLSFFLSFLLSLFRPRALSLSVGAPSRIVSFLFSTRKKTRTLSVL
jgi:hypothetical protein